MKSFVLLGILLLAGACTTVQYPCGDKVCTYQRSFTNVGALEADVTFPDGTHAHIKEDKIDQTTAAANAVTAAAQALVLAAPK